MTDKSDTSGKWALVREVLPVVTARFADLVEASDPRAAATADWTVADTAAHIVVIASYYTRLLSPEGGEPRDPVLAASVPSVTVDTVADINDLALRRFHERDPAVLTAELRSMVATILDITTGADPERTVSWLGASRVPVAGVFAHLINEMLIHGWDIARAVGSPWSLPPREAAPFFDLFIVGMLRNGVGNLLDGGTPLERRIAVAFRSDHTTPVVLVLHRGRISVEEPGGPVDVRLDFDPGVLHLVLFGRVGRVRAALTGKLRITGRRPWLLRPFLRAVRMPTNSMPLSAS